LELQTISFVELTSIKKISRKIYKKRHNQDWKDLSEEWDE